MRTWRYKKVNLNERPPKWDEVDVLNREGKNGWELVEISRNNIALLKCAIDEPAPAPAPEPAATAKRSAKK